MSRQDFDNIMHSFTFVKISEHRYIVNRSDFPDFVTTFSIRLTFFRLGRSNRLRQVLSSSVTALHSFSGHSFTYTIILVHYGCIFGISPSQLVKLFENPFSSTAYSPKDSCLLAYVFYTLKKRQFLSKNSHSPLAEGIDSSSIADLWQDSPLHSPSSADSIRSTNSSISFANALKHGPYCTVLQNMEPWRVRFRFSQKKHIITFASSSVNLSWS